jgi:hypothetical protein
VARGVRLALLALVAALIVGCQETPRLQPRVATPPDLLGQAREAMARQDYETSAGLLRQVIAGAPNNVEAHYRLAVSASWLDLTDEAEEQFQWVVAHGAPGSAEAQAARDWLRAWRARGKAAPAAEPAPTRPDRATLSGQVLWDKDGSVGPQPYLRLFFKGLKGTPVEDEFHRVQTDQSGRYRIPDLVPGEYSLTNRVAGPPIWRLKVTVKAGEDLQLDLTPQNSVKVRDDFPDSG